MPGGYTTCTVMYLSGARTGSEAILTVLLSTQQGLHLVRIGLAGWAVVVAGTTTPWSAGQPFGALANLAAVTTVLGFGLFFPQISDSGKARNRTPQPRKAVTEQALRLCRCFDGALERSLYLFNYLET